jgi:demethylmenaquinone methyltransferase/2-methoxy-6-polyprenyl-1,4-benzoquinol methylase
MNPKSILNDSIKPYNQEDSKTQQLTDMFNKISANYDFFNSLMSWGLAGHWRKSALKWLREYNPGSVLDIATGTADMILLTDKLLKPKRINGIDISASMLEIGRNKLKKNSLESRAELAVMDCSELTFSDESFGAVTISFGIRNLEKLSQSLGEIHRVLEQQGKFLIIEVNEPGKGIVSFFYKLYIKIYVMMAAGFLSNDKKAYAYLTNSMHHFPQGKALIKILTDMNFRLLRYKRFIPGVCSAYLVEKHN